MKKTICILAIAIIVGACAFASDGFGIFGGTSLYDSHIGVSYSKGNFEFAGTYYSCFPNIGIYSLIDQAHQHEEDPENEEAVTFKYAAQTMLEAFTLGGAITLDVSYDVVPAEGFDLDLGLTGAALVIPKIFGSGPITMLGLCTTAKMGVNFGEHSGLYIGTTLPLAALLTQTATNNGEKTTTYSFISVVSTDDDFIGAAALLALYTTRIGYVYHF